MENRDTYNPSDLIYLFLDGEASGVEQSVLFGMLADNSDLQTEFSEAVRLRAAIETERNEVHPPAELTASLFEKAGFGMAPATPAAVAPVATVPLGVTGTLGRFGIPILCAVASAIITAALFSIANEGRYSQMERQIRRLAANQGAPDTRPQSVLPGGGPAATAAGEEDARPQSLASGATTPPPARISAAGAPSFSGGRPARGIASVATPDEAPTMRSDGAMHDGAYDAAVERDRRRIVEPSEPIAIPPAPARNNAGGEIAEARGARIPSISPSFEPMDDEGTTDVSLQIRGISDIGFYPGEAAADGGGAPLDNVNIGGLYHLSSHHALGVAVGREYLPMYIFDGTSANRKDHLNWVAGVYRFQADPIAILGGVRPFAQGTIGASTVGGVGKGTIGVSYPVSGRIDLAIGAEGTALLYQREGSWYSARKSGITYMMTIAF